MILYLNENALNNINKLSKLLTETLEKFTMPLSGAPKAGKSLISGGLYHHFLNKKDNNFFIERLSPDMEGQWTWETGKLELAREMKNKLKAKGEFFSPRFVNLKNMQIPGLVKNFNKTIFDLGGIPSPENQKFINTIKNSANQFKKPFTPVVLTPTDKAGDEWKRFFNEKFQTDPLIFKPNWNFKKDIKKQAITQAGNLLDALAKKFGK